MVKKTSSGFPSHNRTQGITHPVSDAGRAGVRPGMPNHKYRTNASLSFYSFVLKVGNAHTHDGKIKFQLNILHLV